MFSFCSDPAAIMTVKKSSWPQYVARFSRSARRQGYDDDYIAACLDYAQRLNIAGLPIIFDQQHFSLLAGYSLEYILGASNSPRDYYRKFEIPKKSGGNRTIFEPLPSLKEIQRWNLDEILSNIPINAASKAYEKGKSIKDNARFHVNRESVLSMDIKDFFPSISPGRVHHIFRSAGYSKAVATLLTALCSYGKSIPQGAPTSPYISNIICQPIDIRLFGFAKNNDLRYTRYADDMTFSGVLNAESIINFTRRVLSENRFSLNDKKTRLMHKNKRQHVTGVVVNEKT